MPEAFRPLPQAELQLPSENLLLEQGLYDFTQAFEFARTTKSETFGAVLTVAESMFKVGVSPRYALDVLADCKIPDERYESSRDNVVADVLGMLGQEDEMKKLINMGSLSKGWTLPPYLYAIQSRIQRGESPDDMIDTALESISQAESYGDVHDFRASEYVRLAATLVRLGVDETKVRERESEEAAKSPSSTHSQERTREELIAAYSEVGSYHKALDIMDDKRDLGRFRQSLRAILDGMVSNGDFEQAIELARTKNYDRAIPSLTAQKLAHNVTENDDVSSQVAELKTSKVVQESEDRFREVYPFLGIALAKAGAKDEAMAVFQEIEDAIPTDEIYIFDKADTFLRLAHAVHDAGFDSDETYRKAWDYTEKWSEDEEIASFFKATPALAYVFEDGIAETIKRGKFDIAREIISKEQNVSWWKALHMSKLAEQEARSALTDNVAA